MKEFIEPKITTEQAAYMAGLVDGEGCLCIGQYGTTRQKAPLWNVTLSITNTESKLIDWVVDIFGGKKHIYTPKQTPKNSRKPVHKWQITGQRLVFVCNTIRPYTVIKKRQVDIILEICELLKIREYKKGQRGPSVPKKVMDRRFELMYELRSLHNRLAAVKHK